MRSSMAGLKTIKSKIKSIAKTRTVTKAMEAVSAAKMRKSQGRALSGRTYARAAAAVLARVSGSRDMERHSLALARPITRALYVVIVSDKGLAGGLNSGVLRAAAADIRALTLAPEQVDIIAVGRKAADYFSKRGYKVEAFHPNTDDIEPEVVRQIVSEAAGRFTFGSVDVVRVAYQNFISTFEQRPTLRTIFPLSLEELERVVKDIAPARGAAVREEPLPPGLYEVEPSEQEVLGVILPKLAGVFVYHALLESQASEHSARMVAMKSASDKAGELGAALTLDFNKARQAAITREVSEITGGMEAMAA